MILNSSLDFINFPKVELHLHLDCSLSYKVVQQIDGSIDYETYRQSFIAPAKCTDLADYITRAVKGVELMQTAEQLRLVTVDLFEQLKNDNVIYAEIRFAPLLHTNKGLTPEEVVLIVNSVVDECKLDFGIEVGLILCTLRHFDEKQSMQTVRLVEQFKGTNVVGFDIAADEAGFPIDNHVKAFNFAKERKINCTAHAGEAKGPESVWETLRHLTPSRIGHGVRSIEDVKLIEYLKVNKIHLEVCVTSNVQTNVVDEVKNHPVNKLFEDGVSISINTDARTISNTTLSNEYSILNLEFDWKKEHFYKCNLEAIEHAFVSYEIKTQLKEKLSSAYNKYLEK